MGRFCAIFCLVLLLGATGCQSTGAGQSLIGPPVSATPDKQLQPPQVWSSVQAVVAPPLGWTAEPLKQSGEHTHQVWLSPSGSTAYGVIHFSIPLPVSAGFVLPFYLRAMEKSEGEAVLLSKQYDPDLPGMRFVAEGGLYKTRANLLVRGRDGWAVYAGTLRQEPENCAELALATAARERTRVGLPEPQAPQGNDAD